MSCRFTIAAVVLVGCGNPEADRALLDAVKVVPGNVEDVKLHLADGADVNAKDKTSWTPLRFFNNQGSCRTANHQGLSTTLFVAKSFRTVHLLGSFVRFAFVPFP